MPEGLGLVLPTKVMPFARTRLFSLAREAPDGAATSSRRGCSAPDDIAVGTYLRRRLGSPLVDRLAGPLVGGVYGTPIDELSLDAVVPQLRVAEREHRSLLFAGLADGRAMRRAIAKRPPGAKSLGRVRLAARRDGHAGRCARGVAGGGRRERADRAARCGR